MTQEEKYKEALLEARAVLEPCLKYSKGKVREALDSIDNELKRFESEDERILRVISEAVITFFSDYANDFEDEDRDAALAWLEKQKEQKPEWSEEDEKSLNRAINICISDFGEDCETARFLKSLPKRFNLQPKPEWSEEDEKMRDRLITRLNWITYNTRTDGTSPNITFFDEIDWLKFLRPQYHGDVTMTEAYKMGLEAGKASSWKPSEHQMNILKAVKDYVGKGSGYWGEALGSLIEDLEKL